jgi:hypothetical protein
MKARLDPKMLAVNVARRWLFCNMHLTSGLSVVTDLQAYADWCLCGAHRDGSSQCGGYWGLQRFNCAALSCCGVPGVSRFIEGVSIIAMTIVARFGPRTRGLAAGAALCAVMTISRAETSALPPCNADLPPSFYAPVGAPPNIRIWKPPNLAGLPNEATCLGLAAADLRMLVTVAGAFENAGGAPAILARFGEVSKLLTVRYWSTTEKKWRPLILAAAALTTRDSGQPRDDFTNAELQSGKDVYFSQRDSRGAGEVIYRVQVRESARARLVIETENVTAVRLFALTLLKPGGMHALYVFEERLRGIWTYYGLTRIAEGSWLIAGHENSYINRVVALYRHITGVPTDLEPPAAP